MTANAKNSSIVSIVVAWLLVGGPLGWGVYNTLLSSMKLFQSQSAQTMTPASKLM